MSAPRSGTAPSARFLLGIAGPLRRSTPGTSACPFQYEPLGPTAFPLLLAAVLATTGVLPRRTADPVRWFTDGAQAFARGCGRDRDAPCTPRSRALRLHDLDGPDDLGAMARLFGRARRPGPRSTGVGARRRRLFRHRRGSGPQRALRRRFSGADPPWTWASPGLAEGFFRRRATPASSGLLLISGCFCAERLSARCPASARISGSRDPSCRLRATRSAPSGGCALILPRGRLVTARNTAGRILVDLLNVPGDAPACQRD